jgi:outer membrane protein assembly factor BamD (BamD/ComL family)
MSVASIFSSAFGSNIPILRSGGQQFQQEFQQLGQALQSGNLSAAQADFVTLQQSGTQSSSATQNSNPIAQAFNQLSQDLQSGNLSAAQKDFTNLQQDLQATSTSHAHHHHHHSGGGQSNSISQLFQQLGQELQAGNLSAAQQAYSTLSQDLQISPPGSTSSAATSTTAPASSLSVTA